MNLIKIVLFSITMASTSTFAQSLEDSMLQADQIVGDQSVSDYVNSWWQWTYTMPPELSPVRDYLGEHCHVGQDGDVWFLAGGYGSSTINRKCEIPEGKYIFFPVINTVYFPRYQNSSYSCEQAKASAARNNDSTLDIFIELDGIQSWNPASTRIQSPECFDLLGKVPREYNPPKIYPSATDGYWVMLKPLSKGTHKLKFQAVYDRENEAYGKMAQDIEYELVVR